MASFSMVSHGKLTALMFASSQKQLIVEDAIRLLHLYDIRNSCIPVSRQHRGGDLAWRMSMALQLMSCPSMLIVDDAYPGSAHIVLSTRHVWLNNSRQSPNPLMHSLDCGSK
jgi:hypothetical protein